ncbi:hypothetical protein SCHIN_v1c09210 [Spiroplasma chinense]|uniref:Uncharacterized protein n=1 Tax=Spiroplasma chinense TaxID=216932 RepID=A0A5B9Y5M0_9MOLU|nr:hypothetical protein [Spiroplasma chinense]QEH62115.1 hypothetical protein SCHIN_v1c09210 [Spiroplasma chinense]
MKMKNKFSFDIKTTAFFTKIIFKNIKTYIFVHFLSLVSFFALFYIWNANTYEMLLPPIFINFMLTSILFAPVYLALTINEWKKKNLLIKFKVGSLNKVNLFVAVFTITFLFIISSFLVNLIGYNIVLWSKLLSINFPLLTNIHWTLWIVLLFNIALLSVFISAMILVLTCVSKKTVLNLLVIQLVFLFLVIFSDAFANPAFTNEKLIFVIFGYINPYKYFIWTNMLISSYQFADKFGMTQIIPKYFNGNFAPFSSIGITISLTIVFTILVVVLYKYTFRFGVKK